MLEFDRGIFLDPAKKDEFLGKLLNIYCLIEDPANCYQALIKELDSIIQVSTLEKRIAELEKLQQQHQSIDRKRSRAEEEAESHYEKRAKFTPAVETMKKGEIAQQIGEDEVKRLDFTK